MLLIASKFYLIRHYYFTNYS